MISFVIFLLVVSPWALLFLAWDIEQNHIDKKIDREISRLSRSPSTGPTLQSPAMPAAPTPR